MQELPDGSGCFTMSLPLPSDHWIYAEDTSTLFCPVVPSFWKFIIQEHIKRAIKACTRQGKDMDFDPDALVMTICNNLLLPASLRIPY